MGQLRSTGTSQLIKGIYLDCVALRYRYSTAITGIAFFFKKKKKKKKKTPVKLHCQNQRGSRPGLARNPVITCPCLLRPFLAQSSTASC
jgi:hypothetical protein